MIYREKAKIYKPQTAKVVPWEGIEKFYADLVSNGLNFQDMLLLIRFIRNSGLEKKLFGYTSVHKLVITIYDSPEWNREALHIEFNHDIQKFHFAYRPEPYAPVEMERHYPAENISTKFTRYIGWLRW
ncbi:hypothetical protein [Mucilaginibacter sp.]|uniref:hypothetical protein n=1 Tax=Mucilaginibacter sp. TaxID=1882438 RepID=UPI0025E05099|nr:hypothetical protein [Mucilaginibacter sp.]